MSFIFHKVRTHQLIQNRINIISENINSPKMSFYRLKTGEIQRTGQWKRQC